MISFDHSFGGYENVFFDQENPARLHVLHDQISIASRSGISELSLVLHATSQGQGGGVFQARFLPGLRNPQSLQGQDWAFAEIVECRAKLTPRTTVDDAEIFGQWHDALLDSDGGILLDFFLNSHDSQLMRDLSLSNTNTLDLTMEMTYLGTKKGVPFVAHLNTEGVWSQLNAMLGVAAVSHSEIEAAFLSLPQSFITFKAQDNGRSPGRETLIRECVYRAIPFLFSKASIDAKSNYVLKNMDAKEDFALSLSRPRKQLHTTRLTWSLSDFASQLSEQDIEKHFPLLRAIEPFSKVNIRAFNHIPLDPNHAILAKVDLKYIGRGGMQENTTLEFKEDQAAVQSIETVFPALTHEFVVESRVRLILAPPSGRGFPQIWPKNAKFEKAENPFLIDISGNRAQVGLIQFKAFEGVFDYCKEVVATITHSKGKTISKITVDKSEAWITLPSHVAGTDFSLKLEAISLNDDHQSTYIFLDGIQNANKIMVSPVDLFVQNPSVVTIKNESNSVRFAVVSIRLKGKNIINNKVLRKGDAAEVKLWKDSVFDDLNYQWRVSAVREDPSGHSLPIETTQWQDATGPIIKIA